MSNISIIKPTLEMSETLPDLLGIIEIIERDYIVQLRCTADLGAPDLRCQLAAEPVHQVHKAKLANGSEIAFENLVDNSTGEG